MMIFNLTGNLTGRVKAVPPAAGGSAAYTKDEADAAFAPLSHVSDPTVHHTASEIGGIAAAKVAEVVADAPDNLDTLKEIADVIGTEAGQAAGGILKRVADLEAGKADKSEMSVTNGTDANADKTTIQLKTGTSATVLTAHQDMSGKLDGEAAYPAWSGSIGYRAGSIVSHHGRLWRVNDELVGGGTTVEEPDDTSGEWYEVFLKDLKQDALSPAQLAAANSGATAAKVATWDGYAAQIAAKASASDVNTALAQKAPLADLPYALVTPGEWEFSPSSYDGREFSIVEQDGSEVGSVSYLLLLGIEQVGGIVDGEPNELGLVFEAQLVADPDNPFTVTATRPSLPGHLCDRANNLVSVTANTTLTLPTLVTGKSRDFFLKMTVTGSQSVSFSPSSGVAYTGYGNPAKTYSAGTYVLRFTETSENEFCVTDMLAKYAAASHVHSADDITTGTLADARIPNLAASKITLGTIDAARLPVATDSSKGAVQVDGTTITATNGVISVVGGGGGGGVALISIGGDDTGTHQKVVVSGREYRLRRSGSGDFPFDDTGIVIPVLEDDTVSVDYDEYRGDCHVYKNGGTERNDSPPSKLTAGDTWMILFGSCLAYGTLVLMADGTLKRVEDVYVGDRVASINPSGGAMSFDVVVDVSRGTGSEKADWTFEDGRTVSTVGRHRFWNVGLGEMMYLEAWNAGERARVSDGTSVKLVSRATSSGEFRHATLWTEKWNNYFANGLLAGNRRTVKGAY